MHIDQLPYRRLHDQVLDYGGDALYDDVLAPWLGEQDGERRWLDGIRGRAGRPIPPRRPEESWRLYALSRILQLLQLSFAPRTREEGWDVAAIGRDEYARFTDALGLETVDRSAFHPFWHEVVTVDQQPEDDVPPALAEVLWPACRLGPLLVSRAGCRLRAGRNHMIRDVAEGSVLYWAYARNNRRAEDLGSGWGSSSQWRTPFRRDYAIGGALYYNADAQPRGGGAGDDGLDEAERMELLRHRCFVTCAKPGEDRWPYAWKWVENA